MQTLGPNKSPKISKGCCWQKYKRVIGYILKTSLPSNCCHRCCSYVFAKISKDLQKTNSWIRLLKQMRNFQIILSNFGFLSLLLNSVLYKFTSLLRKDCKFLKLLITRIIGKKRYTCTVREREREIEREKERIKIKFKRSEHYFMLRHTHLK